MTRAARSALAWIAALACLSLLLAPAGALAQATPEPYQQGDFLGFRNILPPGTDGTANGPEIAQFLGLGVWPAGWVNQADQYEKLVYSSPGLTNADLNTFFKDGSFGAAPGDVGSTSSPPLRPDVAIQRDTSFGVPHVYGVTRADTIYGAGYASAEDRLFFMDVLRHAGRGTLSAFAGGSNREMDIEQWQLAPYTDADLDTQVEQMDDLYGADGAQVQDDVQNYVDGINAYITEALINPTKLPGEYAAIGQVPQPFSRADIIATASLVGGIFGKGGGGELNNALVLQAAQKKFGKSVGKGVWGDFRRAEDPEAPTTVHNGSKFPYQSGKGVIRPQAVAMPDPGSLTGADGTGPAAATALGSAPTIHRGLAAGMKLKPGNSNALLVSGAHTDTGRPVTVFGPQVSYFIPEILQEVDMHCIGDCDGPGPDIDARGAAFPGISLYVLLGRGKDYAWSATSAGQDIIDTFAEKLCNPDGSKPTLTTNNYLYKGTCMPMEVLQKTNTVTPNAGDQCGPPENPCGPFTMTAYRTVHGIVSSRGTVGGKPVAFVRERSTYMHEADSARAFVDLNSPERVDDAQSFQQAAAKIGFTFNWFYTDDQDIAYFNSGDNPVRARGTDPEFPTWGTGHYDWQGFNPALRTANYTPFSQHPQAINQDYLTSWNNKQAPEYRAAEDNYAYGPIHRSLSLDHQVQSAIAGGPVTRPKLVDAMENAGSVDLRASEVLPYMLDVIGTPANPVLANAVQQLQDWVDDGARRRAPSEAAAEYDHAQAIAIMDAWWPRVLTAVYQPVLGQTLFDAIQRVNHFDDDPHSGSGYHVGSAYIDGWYGYLQKDLRSVLGDPVQGHYSRRYCGNGNLVNCRNILLSSLNDALFVPPAQLYDENPSMAGVQRVDTCPPEKGDQWCWDSIRFRPIGAITYPTIHWINRPTFQQVVQVQGHRPR